MIDHDAARKAFATSLDFPLDPAEREALDTHLATCVSCRAYTTELRSDAAVLREIETGPVPAAVRANIAIAAERGRGSNPFGRWVGIAVVGAILVAAIGAGALGVGGRLGGPEVPGPSDPGVGLVTNQIEWKTEVVVLIAREFAIDVRGRTFRAAAPQVIVRSDPGTLTYRTLEATWIENGVEMRMNLSFAGDAASTWVEEIWIYDGEVAGDWLTARGTFFKTPLGGTWTGDQDIAVNDPSGQPARIHFGGLTLINRPFDGVKEPPGGGIKLPEHATPFGVGGELHCLGILQMTPKQAEAVLLKLGYRLSWRLVTTTGPNTGFASVLQDAPAGVINSDGLPGSEGELIMFVAPFGDPGAKPVPIPADCAADPNQTPPPPPAP
jgi:putative zinc finger protein